MRPSERGISGSEDALVREGEGIWGLGRAEGRLGIWRQLGFLEMVQKVRGGSNERPGSLGGV